MRFIADDAKNVPALEAIEVDANGSVTPKGLQACALTGRLLIQVLPADHGGAMQAKGTLEAIGVEPSWAIYGPLKLGVDFLGKTLLGRAQGLFQRPVKADGKNVLPSDPRWEALVLQNFVAGGLGPNLRCGPTLGEDDAATMAMPELVADGANNGFALGIALGWLREPEKGILSPLDPQVEVIPANPFLRHIGKQLRETVLGQPKGSLLDAIFEGEDSSTGWCDRLRGALMGLGFGDIAGDMRLEAVLREFQIAASAQTVATAGNAAIDPAQLARRDFRDLVAVANGARYDGPVSGRANQSAYCRVDEAQAAVTRDYICLWRTGRRGPRGAGGTGCCP